MKRALISVSDKQALIPFAQQLHELGFEIISTGGTCALLRGAHIPAIEVSTLTQFPEIMDGRVKTLHPKIHGGILGRRDTHQNVAREHGINWIDLVVVNLYPFAETMAIEQIDIGGPAMIRSAAKNMEFVTVVVDPADYDRVITCLKTEKGLTFADRRALASKAFKHTADYDALIHASLGADFPKNLSLGLTQSYDLRYGENPHQKACAYRLDKAPKGLLDAVVHQGKLLSYNNLVDGDAAVACVREFSSPACVIVKHANPCGIAQASTLSEAFQKALSGDPVSAFGGIIALNRPCDLKTAEAISKTFFEVIIAPSYSQDALQLFALKPNQRVLSFEFQPISGLQWHYQAIEGGFLVQEKAVYLRPPEDLQVKTQRKPSEQELAALLFAWQAVRHVKSNAIVIAKENQTLGIGAGQVSRIDAVDIAIRKAIDRLNGSALASDAFFPFRDSIDRIAQAGISLVIQPGGSVRDQEVIQACDEHNIAMVLTGTRCFRH